MPAIQSLTLDPTLFTTGTAGTPYTFGFQREEDTGALRFTLPGVVRDADQSITIRTRANSTSTRVSASIAIPIVLGNGSTEPYVLDHTIRASVEFIVPTKASTNNADYLFNLMGTLLMHAAQTENSGSIPIKEMVKTGQGLY